MNTLPGPATLRIGFAIIAAATLLLPVAQGAIADDHSFALSRNADYSTQDRSFQPGDTIYVLLKPTELDPAGITDNRFQLRATDESVVLRGEFDNHLDGTFTAKFVALHYLEGVATYIWSAHLEDSAGNEFTARTLVHVGHDVRPPELLIRGEIQELGDRYLVVRDHKIFVTDRTKIVGPDGTPIDFGRLQVGHSVEVAAVHSSAGLTAVLIRLIGTDEVHIGGPIQRLSVPDSVLVVQNIVIFVVPNTEIKDADGTTIELADLEVGQLVRVVGKRGARGVVARSIVVVRISPPPGFELEGYVVDVTREGITVNIAGIAFPVTRPRLFIAVNDSTEIRDADGNELGLGDINLGDRVRVKGIFGPDGTAIARRILVLGSLAGHIELRGPIAEIGDRHFRIGPFVFMVDDHTQIFGRGGTPIEFGDLKVGMLVKVFAEIRPDGSLLARRVHVENDDDVEVRISGVITSIGDRTFVVRVSNTRGISIPVAVTDDTRISDSAGNPLTFDDLIVGMSVDVKGHRLSAGGGLIATHIVVRRHGLPIHLVGPIERIGDGVIVVGGVLFDVTERTEIVGSDGEPKELAELTIGSLAKVSAIRTAAGTFVALKIRELDVMFGLVRVEGTIDAVGDRTITVLGKEIGLMPKTRIDSDVRPQPGAFARVEGELLAGGEVVALRIKIEDERSNEARVRGPVDRISNDGISVAGIGFLFTSTTQFEGPDGTSIGPGDIEPGAFVKVDGVEESDGTLIARKVEVRRRIIVRGPITFVDWSGIVVVGRKINLGTETIVLGSDNSVLTSASLQTGNIVEVEAAETSDGTVALRVRVDPDARVVSLEDPASEQPVRLALHQNYPNPFNPSTTIIYEVQAAGVEDIEVSVYDVLGRRVRMLFGGQVGPGVHTLSWDGRDESGNDVASGTYLYRLKSERATETRRMLLLR